MALQSKRMLVGWLLVSSAILTDCNCKKSPPLKQVDTCANGAKACTTDLDCPDHDSCATTNGESCCAFAARTCHQDSDCCPGQLCKRDQHCFDIRVECPNGDSDCGDPGSDKVCLTYKSSTGQTDQVCGYNTCATDADCAAGLSCFQTFCVNPPPCGGHCADGSICIPQNDQCWNYGTRCNESCAPGFLAVEKNPSNVWDSCNNRDVECICAELPPLVSTDLGRHSSSTALGTNQIAVSMYDGQYGDLVVRTYDNTGAVKANEYVDGVPDGGTVVAGPSGPRHGIGDPGDDVGQYTSVVASSNGTLYVSYYDVTHGDLKLAIKDPTTGSWTVQAVDQTGDVGMFTSIALDASGNPAIAYYQNAGATGGLACPGTDSTRPDLITGVKIARTTKAVPTKASDWTFNWVDCAQRPPPPCYHCTSSQTCVGAGVCGNNASGCSGCSSTQVCADTGAGAICQTAYTSKPLLDIPVGVGVFPSLAFRDTNAVVAYYDRINHCLKAAVGTNNFAPVVIDGNGHGNQSADVGLFPNVVVEPTGQKRIAIAYHDATTRGLRLFLDTTLEDAPNPPGPTNIIDLGHEPATGDGPSFVGANVSLKFSSDGKLYAAYQNSTGNDLRLSVMDPTNGWTLDKSVTQGAVGFFSHIAQLPGSSALYVSHAKLHTKLVQNHPEKDNSLQLEKITP